MKESSTKDYRNKLIINQRGGTVEINNSTDREEIKLSQYSGSNLSINNVVTSELATNNKQTTVLHDEYKTVGNNSSTYIEKDSIERIGENSYELKGFTTKEQIDEHVKWRDSYRNVADANASFTGGSRPGNPDIGARNKRGIATSRFINYMGPPPIVKDKSNQVNPYTNVAADPSQVISGTATLADVQQAFGAGGQSDSTQDGSSRGGSVPAGLLVSKQGELLDIERKLGNGGDQIAAVKRHSLETIGAVVNTYPSVRVDDIGRSMPTQVGVSKNSVFKHFGAVPLVEEVDNASNFPCGTKSLTVGNKYNVIVGSGGVEIKTTGPVTISGTSTKLVGTIVNVSGSKGATVNSSSYVDIYAPRVVLRSQNQILIDSSAGIAKNLIVSGSTFTEGELYVNHISAPVEVQQTHDTHLFGRIIEEKDIARIIPGKKIGKIESGRKIGTCTIPGGSSAGTYDVISTGEGLTIISENQPYTIRSEVQTDTVEIQPHSHHFFNLPLSLYSTNIKMREAAIDNNINKPLVTSPTAVNHEFKIPDGTRFGGFF